jgi:CDGSH-type Zn-finger protein
MSSRITPYPNGPYIVRGAFEVTDSDGTVIETRRATIALCRCGASQTKPFCDGTHKAIGFEAPGTTAGQPLR